MSLPADIPDVLHHSQLYRYSVPDLLFRKRFPVPWRFFPDSSHVLQKFFLSVTYGHIFSLKSFHRFPYAQKMPDLFHWKTLHKWFLLLSFLFRSEEEKNWQNPDTYHSQEVNHIPQIPGKAANAVCHNLFPDDSVLPSKEGDGLNKSSLVICNPEMDNTRML